MEKLVKRTSFVTSRQMEFFSEKELTMQIGHPVPLWPSAILKELIDNSLDACETAGVAPRLQVVVENDCLSVKDNGPGLPSETLRRSLDYSVRVSDKAYYVSPTRGRLGNALKCIWAAPFVVDGQRGHVEVAAQGTLHRIDVTMDAIDQEPRLAVTEKRSIVKNGTFIRLHWPEVARCLAAEQSDDFYNARRLLTAYATFNPHAAFALATDELSLKLPATDRTWQKWRSNWPTSAHWYSSETFRALIAAYIAMERRGGTARTVREFVAEFDGLTGSLKQKLVLQMAGLSKAALHDLAAKGSVKVREAEYLLRVMKQETRPIRPDKLGMLNREYLEGCLVRLYGADPASVLYKRKTGLDNGVPFVLEVAFGVKEEAPEAEGRILVIGLNWSPALGQALPQLQDLLAEMRVDVWDPVVMIVHLAYPKLAATDRGKSRYPLDGNILAALASCVERVARNWRKRKRHTDRAGRLARADVQAERKRRDRGEHLKIKEAAYEVMEQAYLHASDPGEVGVRSRRLPAEARQIMYAARPLVMELTGGDVWKESKYFTQLLLPDFMEQHAELTADWDVVFGARGSLEEPHTGRRVPLGTVGVREYLAGWRDEVAQTIGPISVASLCPTQGPANRYQFALFVEKQGFDALLAAVQVAARYDLALMSTKGMSVTAARRLVEELSGRGVTILVLRDFDKSGFSIAHTLRSDTRRFQFKKRPRVVDLGLRLEDAQRLNLQSEPVTYESKKDPRERLGECGATQAECDFLVQTGQPESWWGERIELNAMTAAQFVQFLEDKLQKAGVGKVVPEPSVLKQAYQRMSRLQMVQDAVDAALARHVPDIPLPANLHEELHHKVKDSPLSWDQGLLEIVKQLRSPGTDD